MEMQVAGPNQLMTRAFQEFPKSLEVQVRICGVAGSSLVACEEQLLIGI